MTKSLERKSTYSSGKKPTVNLTAKAFVKRLETRQSSKEREKIQRYFKSDNGGDTFIGVRMGDVFKLAKEFIEMPITEIEKLLESRAHEVRAGGVSIMDFQAREKKTTDEQRKALFDLYLRRHDRINNWDLVDRSAIYVVGAYLWDRPRKVLYRLAKSQSMWERRTSIVATAYFLRKGEATDTFKIAGILRNDPEDLVQKAVGGWIREAGKKHPKELLAFLDNYAANLPRTLLRYAIEKLPKPKREYYLTMKVAR